MKCHEFSQRMQQLIDDRSPLQSDPSLAEHAGQCEDCHSRLHAWTQIEAIVVPPTRHYDRRALVIAALAATVLLAFAWRGFQTTNEAPETVSIAKLDQLPATAVERDVLAIGWWQQVQDRDWVAQTMPAVRGVRDGVAPLGRSLIQAVTILTTGGGGRTT